MSLVGRISLVAFAALFLATTPYLSPAVAYKCQDDKGQWHFSDTPYGLPASCQKELYKQQAPAPKKTPPTPAPVVKPFVAKKAKPVSTKSVPPKKAKPAPQKIIEPIAVEEEEPLETASKPQKDVKGDFPSAAQLKKSVDKIVPEQWTVLSIETKIKKNIGTKAKPKIDALLGVKLKAKSDLYKKARWNMEGKKEVITHIALSRKKGGEASIVVSSISEKVKGKWKIKSEIDTRTLRFTIPGKPLKNFSGKPEILSEYDTLKTSKKPVKKKTPVAPKRPGTKKRSAKTAPMPTAFLGNMLKPVNIGGKRVVMSYANCFIHTSGEFAGNIDLTLGGKGATSLDTVKAVVSNMRVRFHGKVKSFDVIGSGQRGQSLMLTFFTENSNLKTASQRLDILWQGKSGFDLLNTIPCRKEGGLVASTTKGGSEITEEMIPPAEKQVVRKKRVMPQVAPQRDTKKEKVGPLVLVAVFALTVFMLIGMAKVFQKAGQRGILILVPFYNFYIILKIAGRPGWWMVLLFIPFVNLAINILISIDLAKRFGKGALFGLGLFALPFVFFPIIGYGKAEYQPV